MTLDSLVKLQSPWRMAHGCADGKNYSRTGSIWRGLLSVVALPCAQVKPLRVCFSFNLTWNDDHIWKHKRSMCSNPFNLFPWDPFKQSTKTMNSSSLTTTWSAKAHKCYIYDISLWAEYWLSWLSLLLSLVVNQVVKSRSKALGPSNIDIPSHRHSLTILDLRRVGFIGAKNWLESVGIVGHERWAADSNRESKHSRSDRCVPRGERDQLGKRDKWHWSGTHAESHKLCVSLQRTTNTSASQLEEVLATICQPLAEGKGQPTTRKAPYRRSQNLAGSFPIFTTPIPQIWGVHLSPGISILYIGFQFDKIWIDMAHFHEL